MWKILYKNILALGYIDIAIFGLEYFILPHSVYDHAHIRH